MGLFSAASEAPAKATREEMRDARLPIAYRDSCANLLIPLNRCRVDTYYMVWKCEVRTDPLPMLPQASHIVEAGRNGADAESWVQNERHSYEKCQYEEFKKRVAKMDELRASKDGARSN
ncbi:NADH-ubiquinone oxidoreductase B18 subunit-domain-containing protein [Xylaria cf. heliscus]|nr:NADH-ubiquinone oxidoreductase B18 subunit-domain-containing protein [Xylaria cf. heliscus]